jgi:hypothetical protein
VPEVVHETRPSCYFVSFVVKEFFGQYCETVEKTYKCVQYRGRAALQRRARAPKISVGFSHGGRTLPSLTSFSPIGRLPKTMAEGTV